MNRFAKDFRQGWTALKKHPLLSGAALLCLTLGIGATTTVFSAVNTILLQPLPLRDIDRLVMVWDTHQGPGGEVEQYSVAPLNYEARRLENEVFEDMAALEVRSFTLTGDGEPERVEGAAVTHGWLPLLGVEPIHGRNFTAEEDTPGSPRRLALMGYDIWQRRWGGDPGVLDESLHLDGEAYRVIGILPRGFQFPYEAELWVPMGLDVADPELQWHYLGTPARLKPGVTIEEAKANLQTISRRLEQEFPATNTGWGSDVMPMRTELSGEVRPKLLALMAAAAFVLLIACANVACLLLARTAERESELALRSALGASRRQLIQQLLVESAVLGLLGGLLGLLLAVVALEPLVALSPEVAFAAFFREIHVDGAVLAFAFGVSLVTVLLCGLAPAIKAARPELQTLLKEGGRGAGARHRWLNALVVIELAVAVVLLLGAGLMVKSFRNLQQIDPGFDTERLLCVRLNLSPSAYAEPARRVAFFQEAFARLETRPEVEEVSATSVLAMADRDVLARFSVAGRQPASESEVLIANHRVVAPGYLKTLGVEILEGRGFDSRDTADSAPVVIVSEAMARRYWPNRSPVGQRVKRGGPDSDFPWLTIVGVAADVRDSGLGLAVSSTWYLPYTQNAFDELTLVIRTRNDEGQRLAPAVKSTIWDIDPDQPMFRVATMEENLRASLRQESFTTLLIGIFAGLGLVLAVVGIYGVISYSVSRSVREIGIRAALGADAGSILRLILGRGLMLVGLGLGIGLAMAVALARLLERLLFEVDAADPLVLIAITAILSVVALTALFLPARRATRVHPNEVLRSGA